MSPGLAEEASQVLALPLPPAAVLGVGALAGAELGRVEGAAAVHAPRRHHGVEALVVDDELDEALRDPLLVERRVDLDLAHALAGRPPVAPEQDRVAAPVGGAAAPRDLRRDAPAEEAGVYVREDRLEVVERPLAVAPGLGRGRPEPSEDRRGVEVSRRAREAGEGLDRLVRSREDRGPDAHLEDARDGEERRPVRGEDEPRPHSTGEEALLDLDGPQRVEPLHGDRLAGAPDRMDPVAPEDRAALVQVPAAPVEDRRAALAGDEVELLPRESVVAVGAAGPGESAPLAAVELDDERLTVEVARDPLELAEEGGVGLSVGEREEGNVDRELAAREVERERLLAVEQGDELAAERALGEARALAGARRDAQPALEGRSGVERARDPVEETAPFDAESRRVVGRDGDDRSRPHPEPGEGDAAPPPARELPRVAEVGEAGEGRAAPRLAPEAEPLHEDALDLRQVHLLRRSDVDDARAHARLEEEPDAVSLVERGGLLADARVAEGERAVGGHEHAAVGPVEDRERAVVGAERAR